MTDAEVIKRRTACNDCGRRRNCVEVGAVWLCSDCAPEDIPRARQAREIVSADPLRCRHCKHQSSRHRVVGAGGPGLTIAGRRQRQPRRTLESSSPNCGRRFVAVYPVGVDVDP